MVICWKSVLFNGDSVPRKPRYKRLVNNDVNKAAVFTPKEFKRLLLVSEEGRNGKRNKAIIWHLFGSALRITELAQLKVHDVIDKAGEIKPVGHLPASYTKGNEAASFFQVDKAHIAALENYIQERVERRLRLSGKPDEYMGLVPNSPLYLSRGTAGFSLTVKEYKKADGTLEYYYVASSLQQLVSKLMRESGVPNASSHSGRRTLATRLDERNIEDVVKQLLLRHKDINQTMDYIDPSDKLSEQGMKNIFHSVDYNKIKAGSAG